MDKIPSKRLNKLLKNLKDTPYEIGAMYLELLLVMLANSDDFLEIKGIKQGHLKDLKNRINQYLINYENK
jgi:hypothetical protein|tara:strand:+ start:573 stop:782 length:210 start_codon:yes stop_codon:yes gene_type:complete